MPIKPLPPKPHLINNRYELVEKLGEGGMGAVYRAIDRLTQDTVALKQVKFAQETSATDTTYEKANMSRVALMTEFQSLASLHHPNIVRVLDYGWDEQNMPYFTMSHLKNTRNILQASANASIEQQLDYFIQLMQALMYIHRREIVHRDLKPDNILVTADGKVKILDFGIAAHEHIAQEGMLGTLLYMPPEVIQSQTDKVEILRTTDLYAAGLIAYEMFTGEYPFDRRSMKRLVRDIVNTYPDMSLIPTVTSNNKRLNTQLPLDTVIGRLITKEANFRYQDAAIVIEDLAKVTGKEGISESTAIRESFLQAATFIGRKRERKILLRGLKALREKHVGSSFLIGGESGVGKSRLMDEIRVQALVEGITVLRGQPTHNVGFLFQMWRDVVRRLVISTDISDKHASFLREIVPDIEELLGRTIPAPPRLTGEVARKNLINAILSLIAKQKKPMLLVLEDLHWGNESLEVLQHLNQHLKQLPIMVIASFRIDEAPTLPVTLAHMNYIKLNRLSEEEIAELSASMLGNVGQKPEVVDLLQRETEGNIFFVIEVLRVLAQDAGKLENIGSTTLPESVFAGGIQSVLQRRLEQVTPEGYIILKRAAVYGRFVDLHILEPILDEHQLSMNIWLHDCANASVLEQLDGDWRFTHDKLREHIISQLGADETRDLSRELALVVEELHKDDVSWVEMLTSLWHDAGDIEKEIDYLRVLLRQVIQFVGDYDRIRDYADYALSYLSDDDVRCVDFLNPLSQISWHEGHYQRGYEFAMQANELAKHYDYTIGLADSYNNLGNTAYYLGHYEAAIIYYRHSAELHQALGNNFDWALNLQNMGWTFPFVGDYESAWDFVEQGQAIHIEMENWWGIANGYFIMALIASHEGDYDDAMELHYKSLDIYQEQEDTWNTVLNLNNLGFVFLKLNDVESAQRAFYECLQITYNTHLNGSLIEALTGIAHVYARHGHVKQAGLLYGLVEAHPALNSDVEIRLKDLMTLLESEFDKEVIWKAVAHGRKRSVDDVVPKLLE